VDECKPLDVGWPRRPIAKVAAALENSFLVASLYLELIPSSNDESSGEAAAEGRAGAGAGAGVGLGRHVLPSHSTHFEPSFLELIDSV